MFNLKKITILLSCFYFSHTISQKVYAEATVKKVLITTTPGTEIVTEPLDPNNPDKKMTEQDIHDSNNLGTKEKGPLSIDYISNINFGKVSKKNKNYVFYAKNKNPFIQVTDTRGSGAGWILSAKIDEFSSEKKNKKLKGAELNFMAGELKKPSRNVAIAPKNFKVTLINQESKTVLKANPGEGMGTFLNVFSNGSLNPESAIKLIIPKKSLIKGKYSSTIHWELLNVVK